MAHESEHVSSSKNLSSQSPDQSNSRHRQKWNTKKKNPVYENLFTDSWVDVISVNFNSKNDIFVQQDILQFFSEESKDYKYLKSP